MTYSIQTEFCRSTSAVLLTVGLFYCCFSLALADNVFANENHLFSSILHDEPTIELSKQQINLGHFKLKTLNTISYQPQHAVTGRVLNIQSLLELQNKLDTVSIELRTSQQQEKIAISALKRAQKLVAEGITSPSKIDKFKQDQLKWQTSVDTYQTKQKYLEISAKQQWGEKIADLITKPNPQFISLLSGNSVLLLFTVPPSLISIDSINPISIRLEGQEQHRILANFLSISPINNHVNGNSYFYLAHSKHLQIGKRVIAWIPQQTDNREGVMIPESAIIWHNARPWVYLEMGEQKYARRVIDQYMKINEQWFVTENFSAGERIVVAGGATLLSEELRGEIPEEDDD